MRSSPPRRGNRGSSREGMTFWIIPRVSHLCMLLSTPSAPSCHAFIFPTEYSGDVPPWCLPVIFFSDLFKMEVVRNDGSIRGCSMINIWSLMSVAEGIVG